MIDLSVQNDRDVQRVLQTFRATGPQSFECLGRTGMVAVSNPPQPHDFYNGLVAWLYNTVYTRSLGGGADLAPDPAFVAAIAQAAERGVSVSQGWTALGPAPQGSVWVGKAGVERAVPGVLVAPSGAPVGSPVSVVRQTVVADASPAFVYAFGAEPLEIPRVPTLVRIYFHLHAQSAAAWMAEVVRTLDGAYIPFQAKCPSTPALYDRADGGVIYLAKSHYPLAARRLRESGLLAHVALRPEAPWFSKPVAPGVAVAEDPDNGDSFGLSRCRLVAAALFSEGDRLKALLDLFAASGLDTEHPYLRKGSTDDYQPWN